MPLPSSGPISLSQIASEFGVANNLAACYGLAAGIPGSGGGGRGGNGGVNTGGSVYSWPEAGYGASLLGLSPGGGTLYGGGGPGHPGNAYSSGAPGSNLRYRNNVAVAAGQVLSISGPCRIVWGSNRAFPSTNVGNL